MSKSEQTVIFLAYIMLLRGSSKDVMQTNSPASSYEMRQEMNMQTSLIVLAVLAVLGDAGWGYSLWHG